jgi:hypothetical protein
MFRDISGTDGRCRTGNWALDLVKVAGVTAVPEPSTLLLSGLALALLLIGRLRNRRKATLLAAGFVAALSTVPVQAQSNPDFTNVNDILHGNRTLLNITDLEIVTLDPNVGPVFTQITTSNSSQTSSRSFNYNLQGIRAVAPNFSAHMFNQPSAITITALNNFSNYGVAFWLQGIANAGGTAAWTPLPPGNRSFVACGAA